VKKPCRSQNLSLLSSTAEKKEEKKEEEEEEEEEREKDGMSGREIKRRDK